MSIDISKKSIIVCGILRNAEKGLKKNIPVINTYCNSFRDYKVFIYENDSTDYSKDLLKAWQESDPLHVFISLNNTDASKTIPSAKEVGIVNPFFSKHRIKKMVTLRNYYMDFIEDNHWSADYLMVVDLDVASLYLEPIMSSFETDIEWDAVTALGYSLSPKLRRRYHDTYALTEYGDEKNPQTELKIKKLADKYGKLKAADEWPRVFSGFGGLAIYRFEAIKGLHYQLIENNDSRVEVRCEHYSIYKQMVERGYDKVYINPAMTLKYQDLTWKIVLNTIKRKFGV